MMPSPFRSSQCVAVVEDRGTPLVKYSLRQAEELLRFLATEKRRAEHQMDSAGSRFFKKWITELKSSVRVAKEEQDPCCP